VCLSCLHSVELRLIRAFQRRSAKVSRQLWQEGFDDDGNYSNVSAIIPWTHYNKVRWASRASLFTRTDCLSLAGRSRPLRRISSGSVSRRRTLDRHDLLRYERNELFARGRRLYYLSRPRSAGCAALLVDLAGELLSVSVSPFSERN
jgi:hypothetical protein